MKSSWTILSLSVWPAKNYNLNATDSLPNSVETDSNLKWLFSRVNVSTIIGCLKSLTKKCVTIACVANVNHIWLKPWKITRFLLASNLPTLKKIKESKASPYRMKALPLKEIICCITVAREHSVSLQVL